MVEEILMSKNIKSQDDLDDTLKYIAAKMNERRCIETIESNNNQLKYASSKPTVIKKNDYEMYENKSADKKHLANYDKYALRLFIRNT